MNAQKTVKKICAGPASLWLLLPLLITACHGPRTNETVEVAPARFLTLSRVDELRPSGEDGTVAMTIPWNGKRLQWISYGNPVTLRAMEGRLYLITFDRHTNFRKCRLRYYRQNEDHGFDEIPATAFPKPIASQNMWFINPDSFARGQGGRKIYEVDLALQLDPEDPYFAQTLTAAIWCQLQSGLEYYEAREQLTFERKQGILRQFAAEHRPIRLTKIVQRPITVATPQSPPLPQPNERR